MNPPVRSIFCPALGLALATCFLTSCGDDPQLVLKRDQQRAEITKLQSELAILQEKMGDIPPDRSREIEGMKKDVEDNRARIATLEGEIDSLEKEKAEVEKQHQAYRRKYVVR